jgi:Novel STAND NTPase 1
VTDVWDEIVPNLASDTAYRNAAVEDFAKVWKCARAKGSSSEDEGPSSRRGPVRPYPGLRSFSPVERALFHGRDHQIKEVRDRLAASGIVFVIGGSGTGKSSLVRAGLLPYIRSTGALGERSGRLYIAEFRPLTEAREQLVAAIEDQILDRFVEAGHLGILAQAFGLDGSAPHDDQRSGVHQRFQRLARSSSESDPPRPLSIRGLFTFATFILDKADTLASPFRAGPPNLLLVIDQFEEIFASQADADQREEVIELIRQIHDERPAGLFLAVTMRSEALHRCSEWPGLSDVVNDSLYLLEFLDLQDAAREAIIEPARAVSQNWDLAPADPSENFVEEGLVEHLLDSSRKLRETAEHRPDHLPLLQHALQATWDEAAARWGGAVSDNHGGRVDCRVLLDDFQETLRGRAVGANDLSTCLDAMADQALEEAKLCYEDKWRELERGQTGPPPGFDAATAIRIAFCAMAGNDDRGNRERRFATREEILDLVDVPPGCSAPLGVCLAAGLEVFLKRGYLTLTGGQYSVSHEALIRCWKRYEEWLRASDRARDGILEVAQKLAKQRPAAPLEPYPSLWEQPGAWLRSLGEWWVAAREKAAQALVTNETMGSLQLVFGERRQFSSNWAIEMLARDLQRLHGTDRAAAETNLEQLRHEASMYVLEIEGAIPLAGAWWRGARLRKTGLNVVAALLLVVVLGFPAWDAQNELVHAMAVANTAVGEWRDPVSSAYELRASLNHWRSNREPLAFSAIANLLGFPTTERLARQAIYAAAWRLMGGTAYAELKQGNNWSATKDSKDGTCLMRNNQEQYPARWPDTLKHFVDKLPLGMVYCLDITGNELANARPRLLLIWGKGEPIPTVFKLFWYCGKQTNTECDDWRVYIKEALRTGLVPTQKDEISDNKNVEQLNSKSNSLKQLNLRLYDSLSDNYRTKTQIKHDSFEFVQYGILGYEFLDPNAKDLLRITVVFGVSDFEPYSSPPNINFEICEREKFCELTEGMSMDFVWENADQFYRGVRILDSDQEVFAYVPHYSQAIQEAAMDGTYVWLRDRSGQVWRLAYGLDQIEKILQDGYGNAHAAAEQLSSTCQKYGCDRWMN